MPRRIGNATDAGINLDRIAAPARSGPAWIFLDGVGPWEMHEHALAWLGEAPCPICHGGRLRKNHYCSGCDATGQDGRIVFPGEPIDSRPNPLWTATATTYVEPRLRRGLGERVTRAKHKQKVG